jgi:NADH-quinone oxidoreductase subunit M
VVVALFLVLGVLGRRAAGSDSLSDMGGIAFRAPVLATVFLIATLATLAMPGSPNFVGEILILFGILKTKLAFGLVASVGIVLASVYMIRIFQRSMHNRVGARVESREIGLLDLVAVAPVLAVVVALGIYPQFVLGRTDKATTARVARAAQLAKGAGAVADRTAGTRVSAPTGGSP